MLEVTEIFRSVQGESTWAGMPCVFVRLTGCHLRCAWCDSAYAFSGGEVLTIDDVLARVDECGPGLVEITGGEPLLQRSAPALMARLLAAGRTVLLETSGAVSIGDVPVAVHKIVDLKAPSSGEVRRNRWENLDLLRPHDEIKIVLADRADYEWARDRIVRGDIESRCRAILLAPVHGSLAPADLARWMLEDRLSARLNLQLHKYVWPNVERGV